MSWGTDDKLLSSGRSAGAEGDLLGDRERAGGAWPPPALTPADYAARYKIISQAVLAEDPTIKVGPSVIAHRQRQRVAGCGPLGPDQSGRFRLLSSLRAALRHFEVHLRRRAQRRTTSPSSLNMSSSSRPTGGRNVIDRLAANGRPITTPLIASECNPSSWEGTYYFQLNRTMAHGAGCRGERSSPSQRWASWPSSTGTSRTTAAAPR